MTDVGRYNEWLEMCSNHVDEIDTDCGTAFVILTNETHSEWNTRYPDEVWAGYVRPARENGVKPVGMTPMFVVLLDSRPRFTAESLLELHQGTYAEMNAIVRAQQVANIAISKQNA